MEQVSSNNNDLLISHRQVGGGGLKDNERTSPHPARSASCCVVACHPDALPSPGQTLLVLF